MIGTGDLKKGLSVEIDGTLYQIVEVHHIKTKKSAVYRIKLRDLRGGHITERTLNAGEKLTTARVERREMQLLYGDDLGMTFMNTETYDQVLIPLDVVGEAKEYLTESALVQVQLYGEEALGIELPPAVELTVVETEPGVKGDTASGATKPAKMESGLTVQVPLFINSGDLLKISTQDGGYLERVKS